MGNSVMKSSFECYHYRFPCQLAAREIEAITRSLLQATMSRSLIEATKEGDLGAARALLAHKDINVNVADEDEYSPLNWTAGYGYLEIVRALLAHEDIQVNKANKRAETPLQLAASNGHLEIVQALLARKDIKVNQADKYGSTPLMGAALNVCVSIVEVLLQCPEVDINKVNNEGLTALSQAKKTVYPYRKKEYLQIIRMLEARNAREGVEGCHHPNNHDCILL